MIIWQMVITDGSEQGTGKGNKRIGLIMDEGRIDMLKPIDNRQYHDNNYHRKKGQITPARAQAGNKMPRIRPKLPEESSYEVPAPQASQQRQSEKEQSPNAEERLEHSSIPGLEGSEIMIRL